MVIFWNTNYYYYYYHYYYYYTPCEFFTWSFADGFSLQLVLKHVFSGFHAALEYVGQPEECCNLLGLEFSSDFELFQPPFQAFREGSIRVSYNWNHVICRFYKFFILWQGLRIISLFTFFNFHSLVNWIAKIRQVYIFFWLSEDLVFRTGMDDSFCILKFLRILNAPFFRTGSGL